MQERPRAGERLSGVVVVLLDEQVPPGVDDSLFVHARRAGLDQLVEFLLAIGDPPTARQVTSVSVGRLLEAERARLESRFRPLRSLTRYWRIDVEARGVRVEDAVARLREVRGVALAYGELVVTASSLPTDPMLGDQGYLKPAPDGVDATAAWGFCGGRGEGVGLFDIEQAWRLDHDDIKPLAATLLCNTNRDGRNGFPGDHGNATLGVVTGAANAIGVAGIAHGVASVRIASHFKTDGLRVEDPLAVVDALTVVGTVVAPGDVVLIEAQRDGLPVETQIADFDAIRFIAGVGAIGAVVVEPAGNGDDTDGVDLDVPQGAPVAGTQWWATRTDDSGAVLVGAGRSVPESGGHACRRESNFGASVHCHAWGDRVLTAAAAGYLQGYGGTSAASAIVAGVAASVQGMHRAAHGTPLAATDLRALLADPAFGTAQHMPPAKPIGPMPDLRKLAEKIGAVPDCP